LHISKFMELGRGPWELPLLRDLFLEHMRSYQRILQFRCLKPGPTSYLYELVEIPKSLLLEGAGAELVIQAKSRQTPKPGYGYVRDAEKNLKFALYFDGGTERKLQIKAIRKELCTVHATWRFESAALEQSVPR
jgi:type II restriction enzyme